MQKVFVLDINKCTGCEACRVACAIENELTPGTSWRWIDTFNERRHPGVPVFHLSLACNHCLHPPCMKHCPTLAYSKDPGTGAVTIDASLCIGCKYCTWACPYDSPRFDSRSGVVRKCTFCDHRLEAGRDPACVVLCPTSALRVADLSDSAGMTQFIGGFSEGAQVAGLPSTDAEPGIRFIPLARIHPYPQATASPGMAPTIIPPNRTESKITLRSEWPLVAFTLLVSLLVGFMAAPQGRAVMSGTLFLGLCVVGAALSTLHLGRKMQAFRSVANWRRSWLSREVLLFPSFAVLSLIHLQTGRDGALIGWLATIAGLATLIAIDRVYSVTETPRLYLHSARVLLTGALVFGILIGYPLLYMGVGALKMILYIHRKASFAKNHRDLRLRIGAARIALGFLVPGGLWLAGTESLGLRALALGALAVGEIIDRCEFYMELDVPTPRRQMDLDLANALKVRRA